MLNLNFWTLSRPILIIEFLADISLLWLFLEMLYLATSTFLIGILWVYLDMTIYFGLSWLWSSWEWEWLSCLWHSSRSWLYMCGNITFFMMFETLVSLPMKPVALLYYKNSSVYSLCFFTCLWLLRLKSYGCFSTSFTFFFWFCQVTSKSFKFVFI